MIFIDTEASIFQRNNYICIMEQFIVSARKYRPKEFEDVVGQQAITDTLKKAIANDHLAQSLLFTGPRGIGKTTCARILAKKINEKESGEKEQDFSFNIFELDAASNNLVEDIKNLNDQVRIPPQTGKFKVYIIDEVHMLSSSAFNAFLKTLEEPPKHVIFILATTEKHKIIPTILSRCQIFDFKRVSVTDIKCHLKKVAEQEGITADDDALHLIAEHADGALRDALSTFDRVVSFCGNELKREEVSQNLNILDFRTYFEMTDHLANQDLNSALLLLDKLLAKGFDGHHFISGLASHFRDILVAQNQETVKLLEVSDEAKQEYIRQSKALSADFLIKSINIANECDYKYKNSYNQRISLELALMNIIGSPNEEQHQKKKLNKPVQQQTKDDAAFKHDAKAIQKEDHQADTKKQTGEQNSSGDNDDAHGHTSARILPADDDVVKKDNDKKKIEGPEYEPGNPQSSSEEQHDEKSVTSNDKKISSDILNNRPKKKVQNETSASAKTSVNEPEEQPMRKKVAGLSIKSIHQKKKVQSAYANKNVPEKEMNEVFTKDQVLAFWKKYTDIVKNTGKRNLSAILEACQIKVQDNELLVTLPAQGMKEDLQREQDKLLNYLKKNLRNTHIEMHIHVKRTEEKSLVTTREKYDKLVEINPKVEVLRQKFNLEL
jgi:DNA polymerase-3 subunit gamma/tau